LVVSKTALLIYQHLDKILAVNFKKWSVNMTSLNPYIYEMAGSTLWRPSQKSQLQYLSFPRHHYLGVKLFPVGYMRRKIQF